MSKSIKVSSEVKALAKSFVVHDWQPFATSLDVAEKFGKLHKDVLKAFRNLKCSDDFRRRNFAPIDFIDKNGDKQPAIEMTRDGFVFMVMGFTGKKAAEWKEKYIEAFNYMERELIKQQQTNQLEWNQVREKGKLSRRFETDTIKQFIEYAESQGSQNAKHYYVNFTKMVYAELGIELKRGIRDELDRKQLAVLQTAEDIIHSVIVQAMTSKSDYKEIYKLAKAHINKLGLAAMPMLFGNNKQIH